MNPLSAWTFHRRHKRHAFVLLSLSILVTAGIYMMGALVWGIFVEPARMSYTALSRFSLVMPRYNDSGPDPVVLSQIQAHPQVAKVIPTSSIKFELPSVMPGAGSEFELYGLMGEDIAYVLEQCGAILWDGRLPKPATNELLLSKDLAAILKVETGDSYDVASSEFYAHSDAASEPITFKVVGLLDGDVELGIISLEFLNSHGVYGGFPAQLLVVARENHHADVDEFLQSEIQSTHSNGMTRTQTTVRTKSLLNERIISEALPTLLILLPIVLIVTLAFTLVIVVINQIANTQRLSEFGILHAAGLSKQWLIRRLTMETTVLALLGWLAGIGLSWLALNLLKMTLYYLDYVVWVPIALSLLIPTAIAGATFFGIKRTFSRLDPVAIVERGELSEEDGWKRKRIALKSSLKPLASATFYSRHPRRAVLLITGMSTVLLAVVLIIFTLAAAADAQEVLLGYLSRASVVRSLSPGQGLDPALVDQVKQHPAVERVIPVAPRFHMLGVNIPPFAGGDASPFGVYAEDMAYLIDLYDLELKEGRLPGRGSNELLIPESLANNRELEVDDVIGNPDHPAYPGAPFLEAEFVISGILASPMNPDNENWLGFASLEFLETYEPFPLPDVLPLMVVPKAGQKEILDTWLENELASVKVSVLTYRQEVSRVRNRAKQDMLGMALVEGVVASVAAIGLAVLNYIFISQRQTEFGVLHALGYQRRKLLRRALGETTFTIGASWALCVFLCMVGMVYMQVGVFAPLGLQLNLLNLAPWPFTLPIPVIVLLITAATIARTLSNLDPVSIIERR